MCCVLCRMLLFCLLLICNAEAPFAILVKAIHEEDIEVKAAVSQFINNMVMGLDDVKDR